MPFRLTSPIIRRSRACRCALFAGAMLLAFAPMSIAEAEDIFILKSGGQVRGEWTNRNEPNRDKFVIKTDVGELSFALADVVETRLRTDDQVEYDKRASAMPDTAEAHWQLAEWCLEKRLDVERREQMNRVVELDPTHEGARKALNFRQIDGQWMTRDQEMSARGLKFYKGRWRTPQEIEILERDAKLELAQITFASNIKRWRGWLNNSRRDQALANFKAITDVAAVKPIVNFMAEEQNRDVRKIYIDSLAKISHRDAVRALVNASLNDPDQELRLTCLDHLSVIKSPDAVTFFISSLHDKSNVRVNRAAIGLAALEDKSAILPLVDALITEHKFIINPNADPNQMSTTFGGPSGGSGGGGGSPGGMTFGGKGPQVVRQLISNKDVLSALGRLTDGQNFGFDKSVWKRWYASQKNTESLDARRD